MKAWKKGAIIATLLILLFVIPFFNPGIVPMQFHKNADFTKEQFVGDLRGILTPEYDVLIDPQYVSSNVGWNSRYFIRAIKDGTFGIYHNWELDKTANGVRIFALESGGDNNKGFVLLFDPPKDVALEDVLDIPYTYTHKETWGERDPRDKYVSIEKSDFLTSGGNTILIRWQRDVSSDNITRLQIRINPTFTVVE